MAKKINFAMTNQDAVRNIQAASDAIFAHSMETLALSKAKKSAVSIVNTAVDDKYDGEIAKLNEAIRTDIDSVDAEVVEAVRTIGRINYKRACLSKWYKEKIETATNYFRLDDIVEELGANNLEDGVKKVDAILKDTFGLEKIADATRRKFARRVYSAMDGQRKGSASMATKGTLLTDRSRREIKEVGIRAMCEYVAHTANISLKTKEDYVITFEYDKDLTAVVGYEAKNI